MCHKKSVYVNINSVMKLKAFFNFYTENDAMWLPFRSFHIAHMLILMLCIVCITCIYQYYVTLDKLQQKRFMKRFGMYFLIEEALYTLWLCMVCKQQLWVQILPFELCSLCAYMNVLSAFTRKKQWCFFSSVVGLCAGIVAMLYPANIDGLYPVFSYRVMNFYMLHASFILFALLQLREQNLLQLKYCNRNIWLLGGMYTAAFCFNRLWNTQYMFVGNPSNIYIIQLFSQMTGIFFLPMLILFLWVIQILVVCILRVLLRVAYPM